MTLLDANILMDVADARSPWRAWCLDRMVEAEARGPVMINEVVFAEFSVGFDSAEAVAERLQVLRVLLVPTSRPALVLAARAHLAYRRRGGTRTGVLPDFFVGAQAVTENAALLTRDPRRYRTDFPGIRLIHP